VPAVRVDPQPGCTYEEFRREPEQWGAELLDGWWVREPAPSLRHQEVLGRLYAAWLARLGEPAFTRAYLSVHVVLAPGTVVQPDLCYLGPGSRCRAVRGAVHGQPDLVVEVTSEATRERDLVFKRRIYAEHRVPEYWVLDPEWECAYLIPPAERARLRAGLPARPGG